MFVAFWIEHAISKVDVPLNKLYVLCMKSNEIFNIISCDSLKTVPLAGYMQLLMPSAMQSYPFASVCLHSKPLFLSLPCSLCLFATSVELNESRSSTQISLLWLCPQALGVFSVRPWWTVNTMTWYLLCSESLFSPPRSLLLSTFPLCAMCSCRLELAFSSWTSQVL